MFVCFLKLICLLSLFRETKIKFQNLWTWVSNHPFPSPRPNDTQHRNLSGLRRMHAVDWKLDWPEGQRDTRVPVPLHRRHAVRCCVQLYALLLRTRPSQLLQLDPSLKSAAHEQVVVLTQFHVEKLWQGSVKLCEIHVSWEGGGKPGHRSIDSSRWGDAQPHGQIIAEIRNSSLEQCPIWVPILQPVEQRVSLLRVGLCHCCVRAVGSVWLDAKSSVSSAL